MLRKGQARGPGRPAGYVSGCGEPFYGTRVGPGRCQSGIMVGRGCKLPFSVLRMLMQDKHKPPRGESRMQNGECRKPSKANLKPGTSQVQARRLGSALLCSSCAPLVLPLIPFGFFGGTAAVSPSPRLGLTALPCPLFKCNRIFLTGFLSLAAGHLRQAIPRDRNLAGTIQLRKAPLNRRDAMSAEKRAGDKPLKPITFQ